MAAVSSGALGTPAEANIVRPDLSVQQGDNSGGPSITLNVNSTLDEVDANPGEGTCASAANRCTLRAAVMQANARGGHHTINLPAGTYTLTITGTSEGNSATGDLNTLTRITLVGAGASVTAIDGAGIDRVFEVKSDTLELRGITIRNGQTASGGGGFYSSGSGTLTLIQSIVSGNSSTGDGGGIYGFSQIAIRESTVSGNISSRNGGGINSINSLTIVNSTISGNIATGDGVTTGLGGGIYASRRASLLNATVASNSSPRGAGVYVLSTVSGEKAEFQNTLVASNTGSSDCFRVTSVTSLGFNLDGGTGCGFTATGDLQNSSPSLGPLTDNGGPTRTHALQPGSPAIDGGTNAGCPSVDQRGTQRPRDGDSNGSATCDIGAFEAAGALATPTPLPTPGATPTPDADNDAVPIPDNDEEADNTGPPGTPGQTTVEFEKCPGATFVQVRTLTGFAIGQTVRINPGGSTQEDAQVVDVGCDGRNLHLAGPFQYRHQAGETVVVVSQAAGAPTTISQRNDSDDRERSQQQRRTEEQRQQSEQTNRSGRDDLHTEGDVSAVDLSKQPPEITILTRDGRQIVQLLCGDQCPTIRVGDYVEVDGSKQHEGLFHAETVTVTRR